MRRQPFWIALCLGTAAATGCPAAGERPRGVGLEARTAAIARAYLAEWSGADPSSDVSYRYGPTIRFYGKPYSQAQLLAEKRRAVRLWPVRRYSHRPGTMRITCNAAELRCGSRSVIDYAVSNPARGTSARGSTTLDLGVSFAGPEPVILYESGRVRGRDPDR